MAFSDDIAAMQASVYDRYGVPAQWTPAGGQPVTVTLLADQADQAAPIGGFGRQQLSRNVFRVRVSELSTFAPGLLPPAKGDQVQLLDTNGAPSGRALTIVNPPSRNDDRQTEWTLECG